jgi:hypothetical protein
VVFHAATGLDVNAIAQVQQRVRRRLLHVFVRCGLLPADDAQAMAQWDHGSGFSVDGSVCIAAADRAGRERLLRYCARPPFALERLREVAPERVLYESTQSAPGGDGSLRLTPLQSARPPRRPGATATPPPPPLLRRAGSTHRCAPQSPPWRGPQRPRRPHPSRNRPPKRPIGAPRATPARSCSPVSTRCAVPTAVATCAALPSSPTHHGARPPRPPR